MSAAGISEPRAIDDVLGAMQTYLEQHERLDAVASHWNGFEGWLKFELASEMRRRFQVLPWQQNAAGKWEHGQIGVEYRYKRTGRAESEKAKLIDLWLASSCPTATSTDAKPSTSVSPSRIAVSFSKSARQLRICFVALPFANATFSSK